VNVDLEKLSTWDLLVMSDVLARNEKTYVEAKAGDILIDAAKAAQRAIKLELQKRTH
jgi:hypothetical protein